MYLSIEISENWYLVRYEDQPDTLRVLVEEEIQKFLKIRMTSKRGAL